MGANVTDFFRSNFFGVINLVALICGLAYFSGQLQNSVSAQNASLASVERQLRHVQVADGQTRQNTSDISRIRANQDVVSRQLMQISTQISSLGQWVKDHQRQGGGQ